MATLPIPTNTTCDIYWQGHSPPAAPDVAGVSVCLIFRPRNIKQTPTGVSVGWTYDYICYLPLGTDVRDTGGASSYPLLCVPNKNGTQFSIIWVERTPLPGGDCLTAYLRRGTTTFPTDQV
jgi:hypothetical protein